MFLCAGYGILWWKGDTCIKKEISLGIVIPRYNKNPGHSVYIPESTLMKMKKHSPVQDRTTWLHTIKIKQTKRSHTFQSPEVCYDLGAYISESLHFSASLNAWSNEDTPVKQDPKSSSACMANVSFSPFNYAILITRPSSRSQLLKWKAALCVHSSIMQAYTCAGSMGLFSPHIAFCLGRRSLPCVSSWKMKEN